MPPLRSERVGASSRAAIPSKVLRALNEGKEESRTLAEWLSIDQPTLLRHSLAAAGLDEHVERLAKLALGRSELRFTDRLKASANDLRAVFQSLAAPDSAVRSFATSPSDMVRGWLAYAISFDETLSLPVRLELSQRFACDRSMAVRECAWDALRPHVARDLDAGIAALRPWTLHAVDGIRRCAVEATRPRGVWCKHIEALKRDPAPGLVLLEPVRSDPSDYVRRSVANWLNDASKDQPTWVRSTCDRWSRESSTKETAWIVHRALRSLGGE